MAIKAGWPGRHTFVVMHCNGAAGCLAPKDPCGSLTIDGIYSRVLPMNIALTKHFEEMIERLVASGRYNNSSEVVRAGLRILDAEERSWSAAVYPPGSLKHLYPPTENRAERRTARASTLKVEAE
jgi:putative addiction module CopG family antidote